VFVEIKKVFGRNLPLATLFQTPTVETLRTRTRPEGWSPLVPIQLRGIGKQNIHLKYKPSAPRISRRGSMSIFPWPWRRQSVWKPAKKCSGNCWIAANYTWYETKCRKSKPVKGPPNPPKSRCRPKNRLLKAKFVVYLTKVGHDETVRENRARDLHRPMKYWG
jgi:hypothetical protein